MRIKFHEYFVSFDQKAPPPGAAQDEDRTIKPFVTSPLSDPALGLVQTTFGRRSRTRTALPCERGTSPGDSTTARQVTPTIALM